MLYYKLVKWKAEIGNLSEKVNLFWYDRKNKNRVLISIYLLVFNEREEMKYGS